jgi:hypothetical protein
MVAHSPQRTCGRAGRRGKRQPTVPLDLLGDRVRPAGHATDVRHTVLTHRTSAAPLGSPRHGRVQHDACAPGQAPSPLPLPLGGPLAAITVAAAIAVGVCTRVRIYHRHRHLSVVVCTRGGPSYPRRWHGQALLSRWVPTCGACGGACGSRLLGQSPSLVLAQDPMHSRAVTAERSTHVHMLLGARTAVHTLSCSASVARPLGRVAQGAAAAPVHRHTGRRRVHLKGTSPATDPQQHVRVTETTLRVQRQRP